MDTVTHVHTETRSTHSYNHSSERPRHRCVSHPEGERSSASSIIVSIIADDDRPNRSVSDQRQIRFDSPTIRRRFERAGTALASRNLDNPADINASRNHGGCRLA